MGKQEKLYRQIVTTFRRLPVHLKRRSVWVMLSLFLNSVIDLLGIAAIFPLFSLLIREDIAAHGFLSTIYNGLGFTDTSEFVVFLSVTILAIVLLKNIVYLLSRRFQARFAYDLFSYYTVGLLDKTFYDGYDYINSRNSNDLLRDLSHVPRMFGMSLVIPVLTLLNELIVLLIILVLLFALYSWIVLILLVALLPVIAVFYRLIKRRIQHLEETLNDLTPLNTRAIFDVLFGYQDIRLSSTYPFFRKRYVQNVHLERDLRSNITVVNDMPVKVVEFGVVLAILIVMLYSFFAIDSIEDRVLLFGVFGLAAFRIMPSLNKLVTAIVQIKGKQYTLDVIAGVDGDIKQEKTITPPVNWEKAIELKDIGFGYGSKEQILDNLNLTIRKGEFVGIIGSSGSGKTTLVNILLRFLEDHSGELLVDGEPVATIGKDRWMGSLGYVRQDVFLLDTSLKENIALGTENVDMEKLKRAIAQAELTEFVGQLPEGVETSVGERGALISGGQKQRIGIARALYRDPSLLVLDESTSSLDPETETRFLETVAGLVKETGITVVFITHRHPSLSHCDRIYEMNNGKLSQKK